MERPTPTCRGRIFAFSKTAIEQKLSVFERESGLPLSIVMALDTSMSTRKDLPLEVASARKFAHTMLRPVDAISLYEFSTYVSLALPFTNNERSLKSRFASRTGSLREQARLTVSAAVTRSEWTVTRSSVDRVR